MSYHVNQVRGQFPSLNRSLNGQPFSYFDGPGGTQVPQSVIDTMAHYYQNSNANVGGPFQTSQETGAVVERAREAFAAWVGADDPNTISFGPNMTTLNFALSRAISRRIQPGDEVIVTELDHEANVAPWVNLQERGAVIRKVKVLPNGTLHMDQMKELINEKTKIVAVGLASNAIGTVSDVAQISQWAHSVGAWVIVDAVHYAPHFTIDVHSLDADFLLCSAYKFYGPHVGVLYSRPGLLDQLTTDRLQPAPSTAPGKIETGTLNFAGLAGSTAALEFIAGVGDSGTDPSLSLRARLTSSMRVIGVHEHSLSKKLYDGLRSIPGVTIHGLPVEAEARRTPTASFTLQGISSPDVAKSLGEQAIFVWGGHFYAPTLIEKLGTTPNGGVVRVGVAAYNTGEEVDRLLTHVASLSKAL
jgi:cysteine desulfurase family protein (TIGR01976 family)